MHGKLCMLHNIYLHRYFYYRELLQAYYTIQMRPE